MATFEVPSDSSLTLQLLDSVKIESWNQTYTWTAVTRLLVKDDGDKARILAAFPNAGAYTFRDRKTVAEYVIWKKQQQSSIPNTMAIDQAVVAGKQVLYKEDFALIQGAEPVKVPACRVPLEEGLLKKDEKGVAKVRVGSDILAASLGSMTRWDGESVCFCMPIDTMIKYGFVYAKPDGIRPLLSSVPQGSTTNGLRGRAWAYHLMSIFQHMPGPQYMSLMSNYCEAIFNLPPPRQNMKVPEIFSQNIELYSNNGRFYYKMLFKSPSALGRFKKAYTASDSYEDMVSQVVDFAAARQGDGNGISMLAQSVASWGLVSKAQAELEQTVALIIGMGQERTVVSGYSQVELARIRASVSKWAPNIHVVELVSDWQKTSADQTTNAKDSFHLIRGRTLLDTTLTATKTGKLRSYEADAAREKLWEHVESALGSHKNRVYFSAGFPPIDTDIKIFTAGNTWASVFFFTHMEALKRATYTDQGVKIVAYKPTAPADVHAAVMRGMNNAVASWIIPPVNRNIAYSGLLASVTKQDKQYILYNPEDDTYIVEYLNEEPPEIVDPDQEVKSAGAQPRERKRKEKVKQKEEEDEGVTLIAKEEDL